MNCLDKLKRLKDEVGCLFQEGIDKNTAYDQLHKMPQFADVTRGEIYAFYKHLNEKSALEAKQKREFDELEIKCRRHAEEHANQITKLENERNHQVEEHANQVVELQAKEEQMMVELEGISKYQQNASKFLIYSESDGNYVERMNIWQNRYLVTVEDANGVDSKHTLKIQDLFQKVLK